MHLIHLRTKALTASVLPFGASLIGLRFTQSSHNLVLGFSDLEQHKKLPIFAGAIVGPIANRIARGRVTLDGVPHQMPRNEAGRNTLHSGPNGLHNILWDVTEQYDHAATFETTLADGACGLPGKRAISVRYALDHDVLTLSVTATTDVPTPMNIAPHPYWNLDGQEDVTSHRLLLNTNRYLPTNDQNLPTGKIAIAKGDLFDFSVPSPVPQDPALDVNFCYASTTLATPQPVATLIGATGTTLRIATTAPGLQVYNGSFLPDVPNVLSGGGDLKPYGGIALEPQYWPDAPTHPSFPQITLHPNQTFQQVTTYQLSRS